MNKVYNTVWNESTGTWVVTSELTRKGGRRPRQIKRTALAGLIAGLLMPSQPVLATAYDNQTIGSDETRKSMHLSAGDTAKKRPLTAVGSSMSPVVAVPRVPPLTTAGFSMFLAAVVPLVPPSTAVGTSMSPVVVVLRMQLLTMVGDRRYSAAAVPWAP